MKTKNIFLILILNAQVSLIGGIQRTEHYADAQLAAGCLPPAVQLDVAVGLCFDRDWRVYGHNYLSFARELRPRFVAHYLVEPRTRKRVTQRE